MFSKPKAAILAVFDAVRDFVGSTAFRHRIVVVLTPLAAEVVIKIQGALTGVYPDGSERATIDTVCLLLVNYLRGRVAPA